MCVVVVGIYFLFIPSTSFRFPMIPASSPMTICMAAWQIWEKMGDFSGWPQLDDSLIVSSRLKKMRKSNWIISPGIGVEIRNIFETYHLYRLVWFLFLWQPQFFQRCVKNKKFCGNKKHHFRNLLRIKKQTLDPLQEMFTKNNLAKP